MSSNTHNNNNNKKGDFRMSFDEYTKQFDELMRKKETILKIMIDLIEAGEYNGMEVVNHGAYEQVWQEIRELNDEYYNQD